MLAALDHFREIGGRGITVTNPMYVFESESETYRKLVERLEL